MKTPLKPDHCPVEGCPSTELVLCYARREQRLLWRCEPHAELVVDDDPAEYRVFCPHCDCMFGVN